VDAHWVSLQYKDAEEEIKKFRAKYPEIDLVQYRQATLTDDYDDTAGLVAALNLVICVQTAVAHLCGAIGKECWVMVSKTSQWRYAESGETIPWYRSLRVHRQKRLGEWEPVMQEVARDLKAKFGQRIRA
jgi:ADP-heptose:LPS heptosyltransferase